MLIVIQEVILKTQKYIKYKDRVFCISNRGRFIAIREHLIDTKVVQDAPENLKASLDYIISKNISPIDRRGETIPGDHYKITQKDIDNAKSGR